MRRLSQNFIILICAIIITLLVAEGLAWGLLRRERKMRQPHMQLGFEGRNNARFLFSREGTPEVLNNFNDAGFNDRNHAFEPSANNFRIAIVGDSFVEAKEVPQTLGFPSVLERLLNERLARNSRRFEVMNFGVGGYGWLQYEKLLKIKISSFKVDLILLVTYGNDVFDDIVHDARQKYLESMPGRLFRILYSPTLFKKSFFYQYVYMRTYQVMFNAIEEIAFAPQVRERLLQCAQKSTQLQQCFPLSYGAMHSIENHLREQNIPWKVFAIPLTETISTRHLKQTQQELTYQWPHQEFEKEMILPPHLRVVEELQNLGVPVQNWQEHLESKEPNEIYSHYFERDEHFTIKGNKEFAEYIYKGIVSDLSNK